MYIVHTYTDASSQHEDFSVVHLEGICPLVLLNSGNSLAARGNSLAARLHLSG